MDDLTDEEWQRVEPLLPPGNRRGRPRADDRRTVNGILYVLLTGCPWGRMPRRYGSAVTCWRRLRDWTRNGHWRRIEPVLADIMAQRERAEG